MAFHWLGSTWPALVSDPLDVGARLLRGELT